LSEEYPAQQKAANLQASDTTTTAVPPPPLAVSPTLPRQRSRSLQFALFLAAMIWYLCARLLAASSSSGLSGRFDLGDFQPLIEAVALLFLLVCGVALLRAIEQRRAPLRLTLGLPRRSTWRAEWATGSAIGWGIAIASVLPMLLARSLNVHFWTAPRAWELLGLGLLTLAVATLAHALAVFGYGYQRLIEATGPVRATLIVVGVGGVYAWLIPTPYGTPDGARILVAMVATLLFCLSWLRTHGLWLLWGMHFAMTVSIGILFGLPLGGNTNFASVVDTRAGRPVWLTGGDFGPAAALISVILLLAAIPVLVRVTGDYAWNYTHPPLIPAGYDVTIPPSAAHVAMEQAAAAAQPVSPASLVQILPATPRGPVLIAPPE
jgi:uncharacterized protein